MCVCVCVCVGVEHSNAALYEFIDKYHVRTSCKRAGSFMRVAVSAAFLYSESSIYSSKRSSASVILSMYFSASLNGSLYLL